MDEQRFQFPSEETLAMYLALLRAAILEARIAGYFGDAALAADIMDAIESLPDLLARFDEMDEEMIWGALESLGERAPRLVEQLPGIRNGDYRGLLLGRGNAPNWRRPLEPSQADRIEGALLGTMIGDALGRPFEGTPASDLAKLRAAVQRRIQAPRAWGYTDDSEMMLAVADSLIECGGVEEAHVLATMAESHDAARGYGKGARAAFRVWNETGSWQLASKALWDEGSRGNGAAVRVAPVAILHRNAPAETLRSAARRSAMPTHAHREAVAGAEMIATAIWLALKGVDASDLLAELVVMGVPESLRERIALVDLAQPAEDAVPLLGHGVLAIESVPLALWAHCRNRSFESAVLDAVCAGGDTDTIGAMTGAIAGATYGARSIPETWVEALGPLSRSRIGALAAKLGH